MHRQTIVGCLLALCLIGTAQAQSYGNFMAALQANQNNGYSRIKQAVDFLGLSNTFSNPQLKVTVFVPTDKAFSDAQARFPMVTEQMIMQNKGILQQVVYYHIVKDVIKAPLPNKSWDTFISGKQVTGAGNVIKGLYSQANIVKPNMQCGAGFAHGIDNVLMFTDVSGFLG